MWLCIISYEHWLTSRNKDASKKIDATWILVFDFDLFIGGRFQTNEGPTWYTES